MSSADRLKAYFNNPLNLVTRERIFFHRLAFDLKIAAARADYHLNLYVPDVDRDGFDIIVEDEDAIRSYQTKAVLSSGKIAHWKINVGFLRPALDAPYGHAPAEAGRGGGVILIEINDKTAAGAVSYSYTDFDIITAIEQGFLIQRPTAGPKKRGKAPKPARQEAADKIAELWQAARLKKIFIPRTLFLQLKSPDDLLGVMRMRSEASFNIFPVRKAYGQVIVDKARRSRADAPLDEASALDYHMRLLCDAQDQTTAAGKATLFDPFTWKRPKPGP